MTNDLQDKLTDTLEGIVEQFEPYVIGETDDEIRERNEAWVDQAKKLLVEAGKGKSSMPKLSETIREAAVEAYWQNPYPSHITIAVVAATGCKLDIVRANRIIARHLEGPSFVAMAEELAGELREARGYYPTTKGGRVTCN